MEEEKDIVELAVKVKKSKNPVDYKVFMSNLFPMKLNERDGIIEIIRPDMNNCKVEGLAPYGSYAKIIVDKKKEVLNVWSLDGEKSDPDFRIVNGLKFSKD